MPRPLGRDRLEPTSDETIALLSLHPKPWAGREEVSPRAPVLPGTAVRWDGELFEVLSVEPRPGGGWRHVLAPWDDRFLVRTLVEYGDAGAAARSETFPEAPAIPVVSAAVPTPRASGSPAPGSVPAAWGALAPGVRALLVAFVPSVLLGWFFPFRVMGEGISFLVHELGHTLVAWFFGCSAMPAIVMTIVFAQSRVFAALVWGALVFFAVKYRHAPRWNVGLAALALGYPLVAFTPAHLTAFDIGGHLAEVAFAAWAFRRAVRGERPDWELPVWAFFAFYLVARNVKLFGGVVLSAAARTDYQTIAIAGQNDMVKVAATTGLSLTTVAAITALVFLVVPLGALAFALRAPAEPSRLSV
ncbi:MAG: hypothetical protein IPF66_16270 [Holophagales bacterium]|nr:hypothetical protein [Holophagales bacterium]